MDNLEVDLNKIIQLAIENYAICPIVFNVFESLKVELGHE